MPPKPGALLDPTASTAFIDGHRRFLLTVPTGGRAAEGSSLKTLVDSRDRIANNQELLCDTLAQARSALPDVDVPVLQAIGTLRVANWVYLKEARSYAVFLDPSGDSALGVRYCGHYVCDGLVSRVVHLGRNYLRSFTSAYRDIRTRGHFEVEYRR